MNTVKEDEKEKHANMANGEFNKRLNNIKNESINLKTEQNGEDFLKIREPSNVINSQFLHGIENNKHATFSLPETSPTRYHFGNSSNLLISPTIDNKSSNMMMTPLKTYHHEYGMIITPNLQYDIRMDYSPFPESSLRHNERSSSFKRMNFNNIHNEILGRNLNEMEYFSKKQEYLNKHLTSFYNNKLNISSESESCSKDNDEDDELEIYNKNKRSQSVVKLNWKKQESGKKLCCTCTKSKCLKKYCECYANKVFCSECDCKDCYNTEKYKDMIKRSILYNSGIKKDSNEDTNSENQVQETVCNCTKSNCNKKYCECYKAGEGCKDNCRCLNCENNKQQAKKEKKSGPEHPILDNAAKEKIKASRNPINFIIEGTSVYIRNEDISITQRKETPQLKNHNNKIVVNFGIDKNNPINETINHRKLTPLKLENPYKKNLKNIFRVKPVNNFNNLNFDLPIDNNTEIDISIENSNNLNENETPKIINKKRKRFTDVWKEDSHAFSSSTHFQTPMLSASTSRKTNFKKKINLDENIVKNLDKIY